MIMRCFQNLNSFGSPNRSASGSSNLWSKDSKCNILRVGRRDSRYSLRHCSWSVVLQGNRDRKFWGSPVRWFYFCSGSSWPFGGRGGTFLCAELRNLYPSPLGQAPVAELVGALYCFTLCDWEITFTVRVMQMVQVSSSLPYILFRWKFFMSAIKLI
jgi:hypothetical protein